MNEPVLILTYYWPPSGGSGVQRWMYFAKYLGNNGVKPYVVTVDEKKASYKFIDQSFNDHVKHVETVRTSTREVLKLYSRITTGKENEGIPQAFAGESKPGLIKKAARFIRGNFFIPDARKGWNKYAYKAAADLIKKYNIKKIITTGPPHSTHLTGLRLKNDFNVKWIADFRDPWREVFYNNLMYRTKRSDNIDAKLEQQVIDAADCVLTVGQGMAELLRKKTNSKEKVKYILNGFDEDAFENTLRKVFTGETILISHIGVLGNSQPITSFLKALERVLKEHKEFHGKIRLQFIGKVSDDIAKEIEKIVPEIPYTLVNYVSHAEAISYMVNSHLLLNSLAETEQGAYLISGKLMEYIASGRPVLGLGHPQGDAAKLLEQFHHCKVFDRSDVVGIEKYLDELLKAFAHGNWCEHDHKNLEFTRRNSAKALAKIIEEL